MSKPKMIPEAPAPNRPGLSPLERTADLTRRLLHVPRSEMRSKAKRPKRKR